MPLPPAVPPPENVWSGEVNDQPQIVEELPADYEDPQQALDSLESMGDLYDYVGDVGAPLADGLEKANENDELSETISAENRAKATEASDSPPDEEDPLDNDEPPIDDTFKDTAEAQEEKAPEPVEDENKVL